jgi:hypothetical protein
MRVEREDRVRRILTVAVAATLLGAALALADDAIAVKFDDMEDGKPPAGFSFGRTGQGAAGTWVVRDKTLAQTSTDNTDYRFPVALYDGGSWKDVAVSVRFKAVSGEVDRAGGIVFRAKDENNYYLVRSNALEDNTRIYKVVEGRRKQFGGKNNKVTPGEWHALKVEAAGDRFSVWFDGEKLIDDATDDTFKDAGKVGLWTKADSVTLFQDLTIEPK